MPRSRAGGEGDPLHGGGSLTGTISSCRLLSLCFLAGPTKGTVLRSGEDSTADFAALEVIDLIRTDIASTFESGYIGKVLNDYDNKLLLVTAFNAYIRQLEGDVLDKTVENLCEISLEGQRTYLQSIGTDTANMSDMEILKANTGSQVFLVAHRTFCDAMEDLSLKISM